MPYESIVVTPLSPHIGGEISHIDLTQPLSTLQQQELRRAFTEFQVIFFRDQRMSSDDLVRMASYFGELAGHVGAKSNAKPTDNPFVLKFHFDEKSKRIAEREFHSDQSCAAVPPAGSLLYNHTLPPDGGGDTLFANMYAAYDALSEPMKVYLEGLTAVHDGSRSYGAGSPVTSHPVIVRHAESGKKCIFVNSGFTTRINELPDKEGRHILQFLFDHCNRAEWTCRFRWRPHSVAFWDNRCTLHKAIFDYWPHVRSGYRVYVRAKAAPAG